MRHPEAPLVPLGEILTLTSGAPIIILKLICRKGKCGRSQNRHEKSKSARPCRKLRSRKLEDKAPLEKMQGSDLALSAKHLVHSVWCITFSESAVKARKNVSPTASDQKKFELDGPKTPRPQ